MGLKRRGEIMDRLAGLPEQDIARVLADASALKDIKARNKELVRKGRMKDDLFQMLVHDLKGPISEILSNVDLLKLNPNMSEDDLEIIDTALCGCHTLNRMVTDLLDISKMEEKKYFFVPHEFDIVRLASDKADQMKALADRKGVELVLVSDPSVPHVMGDEHLMERVIANLFLNAINYSYPERPVTISIRYLEGERAVLVGVLDKGEGIPKSQQKKIFEKYGQRYAAGTKKRYSTGLGLTFCKMAVEKYHKGKIWVESEEGKGSAFHVKLPLRRS